jgi:hypothetical protein
VQITSSPYDIEGNRRRFFYVPIWSPLGGPIIKDKLHFIAWDHQQDSRPLIIADVPGDELRFNVTRATLDNFVTIARNKYGVSNSQIRNI